MPLPDLSSLHSLPCVWLVPCLRLFTTAKGLSAGKCGIGSMLRLVILLKLLVLAVGDWGMVSPRLVIRRGGGSIAMLRWLQSIINDPEGPEMLRPGGAPV